MVDQSGRLEAAQIFRKQSRHEEREITDVLMHVPFTIHPLGLKQHFRFKQEVHHRIDRLVLLISDFLQVVGVGKVDEQVGDVAGDVQVGPPEMFREAFLGQGAEQLAERMPWWNLRSHIHLSHIPKTYELSIADDAGNADS